ncbi:MAG: TIGR02147 family protein [Myxococcota bacterium]
MDPLYQTTDWRTFLLLRLDQLELLRKDLAAAVEMTEGWLSNVLTGRRRLDPELVPRLADALRLDADGTAYFEALADLENESRRARRAAWAVVAANQRHQAAAALRHDELEALTRWYVGAVLELARCEGFRADPRWIAAALRPTIPVETASEALSTLIRLGMLQPDEHGGLVPTPEVWSPSEIRGRDASIAVATNHRATLALAIDALHTGQPNERRVTGTIVAVSEGHYATVVAKLRDLERELVTLASDDPGVRNRVYHFGIHWIPCSEYTDAERDLADPPGATPQSIDASNQGPPPPIEPDTTE